jgi:hypothetical protein
MAEHAVKEHKNWVVTFGLAMGLFLIAYLFTLWFGHSLVGEHHAAPASGAQTGATQH